MNSQRLYKDSKRRTRAVRRMLQAAGFRTERIPGPPGGKREILRARK